MARHLAADRQPVALIGDWAGGGALLASDPVAVAGEDDDPFEVLDRTGDGTWVGWLGYRLGARLERLPADGARPVERPPFVLACFRDVVRLDRDGTWWVESPGEPDPVTVARWRRRLAEPAPLPPYAAGPFRSRPDRGHHCGAVEACQLQIAAGDLYQANVCLRLEARLEGSPLGLWCRAGERLRPARAAFVADAGGTGAVASLSPEVFLLRHGDSVTSMPVKGTRPRTEEGLAQLLAAEKDRAEHVMIVDLVRNDLGRVALPGSVAVPALLEPRPLAGVWHLVSTVTASVAPGVSNAELVRACFPPGSVTGAPKRAAVSLCHRLEETAREAYCGAVGFSSPDHGLELNVAIRTFEAAGGRVWLGLGGGVVADSDPVGEWEECRAKAAPLLDAVGASWDEPAGPPPAGDPGPGVLDTVLVVDGRPVEAEAHRRRFLVASGVDAGPWLSPRPAAGTERLRLRPSGPERSPEPRPPVLDGGLAAVVLAPVALEGGWGPVKVADRRRLEELEQRVSPALPLLLDQDGMVLETTRANVFAVAGGCVLTPPLDGRILPGVTRRVVLDLCVDLGLAPRPRPLSLEELAGADAVFTTSAIAGLAWASEISGVTRWTDPVPVVRRLASALGRRWGAP